MDVHPRVRRVALGLLLFVAAAACATTRRKADAAYERRAYIEAAELYDRALFEDPRDDRARAGRGRARYDALAEVLEEARSRRAGARPGEARAVLGRFFRLRQRWVMPTPPPLVAALQREVDAASSEIEGRARPLLAASAPLAAEAALAEEKQVFEEPEMVAARRRLRAEIATAGERRCAGLRETVGTETPYWGWLVARYCRHFDVTAAPPRLPFLASGIELRGALAGVSASSAAALAGRLRGALAKTPWYTPDEEGRIVGELSGVFTASYRSVPVTLEAPWTEKVPYTTTEARSVPHQVSRSESETYYVSVPYTSYQTETYSCGTSGSYRTCSRSHSVTNYRSEARTRYVTRHHTEYRTEYHTVTRYRDVPHVFAYRAERLEADFSIGGGLSLALPAGEAPLDVSLNRKEAVHAISHDVTFEPAGISPTQARLPTPDEWLLAGLDSTVAHIRKRLHQAWGERFCGAATFTIDEASRCLYGGQPVPAATEGLRATAGIEADALAAFAIAPGP